MGVETQKRPVVEPLFFSVKRKVVSSPKEKTVGSEDPAYALCSPISSTSYLKQVWHIRG
jgi:hypothetical protein